MAKKTYTIQEQIRAALVTMTRKQLAEKLGISMRTLRRRANEGVEPRNKNEPKILAKVATTSRATITRKNKKLGATPFSTVVPIIGHRRKIVSRGLDKKPIRVKKRVRVRDKNGRFRYVHKWVAFFRLSEWINFDVQNRSLADMFRILRSAADNERCIQFIYLGAITKNYPNGVHGSPPIQLDETLDDTELIDKIFEYVSHESSMLYIGVKNDGCTD